MKVKITAAVPFTLISRIEKGVKNLNNGDWDLWLDDTHKEHKISEFAFDKILNELQY